jgi:hypothetical protein
VGWLKEYTGTFSSSYYLFAALGAAGWLSSVAIFGCDAKGLLSSSHTTKESRVLLLNEQARGDYGSAV